MASCRTLLPLLLLVAIAVFAATLPQGNGVAAATSLSVTPSADAWLNRAKPNANYGSAAALQAASGSTESILKFNVGPWFGFSISELTLAISGLSGNAAGLTAASTGATWKEASVTWQTRPSIVTQVAGSPVSAGATATFDVATIFPSGTVDNSLISVRIRNNATTVVRFGSRESAAKPRLTLTRGPQAPRLAAIADTWVDSTSVSKAHPAAPWLFVDGQPRTEAFVVFDTSAWRNWSYSALVLELRIRTSGGRGVSVYRVPADWTEAGLTWKSRPAGGTLLAQPTFKPLAGVMTIDVSQAFAASIIDTDKLALRIVTSNSSGFDFSSREGSSAPQLLISAAVPLPTPTPTATPLPSPSPSPSPSPTPPPTPSPTSSPPAASPTPIPTGTPTNPPSAPPTSSPSSQPPNVNCPTPSPSTSPTPTPTDEPLFYFWGLGTDHGAGMSQQGARGRALAGQTYDQILAFYYTGVDFTVIDGMTPIRVLLGDSFWPTPTLPARITALVGGWQSAAFPGVEFPAGSYVEMWPIGSPPPPTPTPDPCGTPTPTPTMPTEPTPAPTSVPTDSPPPTQDPGGSPTPTPSSSPTPTPVVPWIATVYDSSGAILATSASADLLISAVAPDGVLEMRYRDELPKYKTYRGSMRLVVTPTGLETVNILPLESYLRGVVPAEVPASWPMEAVKSQAVAARTYAWSRLKTDREWDVLPTAANQVYGGYQHEEARSDAAIIATQNLVLTYQGKVISALYHACAGGYTENSEYAFPNSRGDPGNVIAYLRGKPDVDANGVPYDATAGSFAWETGQFTMSQLSAAMNNNPLTAVGDIYSVTFHRGVSGRIYQVILEGSLGVRTVSGGKFKNTYNDYKPSGKNIKSTMYYLTPVPPTAPS